METISQPGVNIKVQVSNWRETRSALAKFAPEVKKALDKANREAGKPLVALAQSYVPADSPLSGWADKDGNGFWNGGARAWNSAEVKRGIKIKQGKRSRSKRSPWSAVTMLVNDSAAGMIFETAGSKSNGVFVQNLINKGYPFKEDGVTRIIWKAVKNYPIVKYRVAIKDNYAEAEKQLQRILDSMENTI